MSNIGYVTYCTPENTDRLTLLIESLTKFSKYKIIIFQLNTDQIFNYENVITRTLSVPDIKNDLFIADLVLNSSLDLGMFIPPTMIAGPDCDFVLEHSLNERTLSLSYPYCSRHNHAPDTYSKFVNFNTNKLAQSFDVISESPRLASKLAYVAMPFIYSQNSMEFFSEIQRINSNLQSENKTIPGGFEAMLNIQLMKNNASEQMFYTLNNEKDKISRYIQDMDFNVDISGKKIFNKSLPCFFEMKSYSIQEVNSYTQQLFDKFNAMNTQGEFYGFN